MKQSIIVRVVPENFDQWRTVYNECRKARRNYGIMEGPVYREETNSKNILVHLKVKNPETAAAWFKDVRFKAAVQRAGIVSREIWIATLK